MQCMARSSKFLPESISVALRGLVKRVTGAVFMAVALWALYALIFFDPYLDGFAVASNFGNQSVMGWIVGFLRYGIGFVPALFLVLYVARCGLSWLVNLNDEPAPEYNFLRCVVALCMGAVGLGLIAPASTYGGAIGAIAAFDVGNLIGGWGIVIGILAFIVFVLLASVLLHIKWAHIKKIGFMLWRAVQWILSVFHLMPMSNASADDDEYVSDDEEDDENIDDTEEDDDTDIDDTKKKRAPRRSNAANRTSRAQKTRSNIHEYELPDPAFLERSNFGKNVVTPELKRNAASMEVHFTEYGVYGKVVGIRPGPIVTLYEFLPDSGVRIADIKKTVTDMTRAMAAPNIRIAHIPSTQLIGVEMANLKPQTVRFRSLVENDTFVNSKYKIPLALGVSIGGDPMYYDLAKMPHMLIAGRTGSGKSVFVQSIITSIVYHFTPDKCKLVIIDPKGVDFGCWDDIPHLITPIVKLDPNAAVNALKWAVNEMENRYKQLQKLQARNIETYNEIAAQKRANGESVTEQVAVGTDEETGELLFETKEVDLSDMPYIVIIVDEVADLMNVARKEVEACIQRIAQKARAAGIHLVMATQRPDATIITGVIKANFPTRVSFQARSGIDSMTTLGEKGAEQLLKCGDMLFSEAGSAPVRIHGALISDDELNRIGNFLRAQGEPEYADGVTDGDGGDVGGGVGIPGAAPTKADKDADLYTQAKEVVLRDKKPTISYIQRRLGVGYNKAAGFMERMEQEGIVSPPDANNKRHIL